MIKGSLIEIAYDYLKQNHKTFMFKDIWNGIKDYLTIDDDIEALMGELYTDLVLDNRFALTENGEFALSDYVDTVDIKKNFDSKKSFHTTEELVDENTKDIFDDSDTQDNISKTKKNLDNSQYNFEDDEDEDFDEDDDEEDDDEDFFDHINDEDLKKDYDY